MTVVAIYSYFLLMSFTSSVTNLLVILVFMELLSWIFLFLIPSSLSMKYLLIQSYFTLMLLVSILWVPSLLIFSFFLKTGLPPFQGWVMYFSSLLPSLGVYFLSSIHKIIPLFLLGKVFFLASKLMVSVLLLMVSSMFLFQSSLFLYILICSSMVHSTWVVLGILVGMEFMLIYWFIYSIFLWVLMNSSFSKKVEFLLINQGVLSMMVWLILSGIPPFVFFWLKVNLFFSLLTLKITLWVYPMIISSILALCIYFWGFHLSMMDHAAFGFKVSWSILIVFLFSNIVLYNLFLS